MGSETTPCTRCGHPGPFIPKSMPHPDPRKGMTVLCAACKKDITYDTHQWKDGASGRWVCCGCMGSTKLIRDLTQGKLRRPTFQMVRREVVPDAVHLFFQHDDCDQETMVMIDNSDDLTGRAPIKCVCGFSQNMFCSNPELMRKLIEVLRRQEPRDRFRTASDASQN